MVTKRAVRCVASTGDFCGEGAVWHPQEDAVFWTDINRFLLHRYDVKTADVQTWKFDQPVTAVVLTTDPEQIGLILGGGVVLWNVRGQRTATTLLELPGWPVARCNDARVDPSGILWVGTMQNNVASDGGDLPITKSIGELFSLNSRGETRIWRTGMGIENTVAWSHDAGQMYFADTLRNQIYRGTFDVGQSSVGSSEIFAEGFARGLPDGSSMDVEGYLWNCRHGGGCVVRFAPDGSVAEVIDTPAKNPTTCTFGGKDWKTLYITSAGQDAPEECGGGSLFAVEVETPGLPTTPFRL
jgi:sugar lactone lactonase YvrE